MQNTTLILVYFITQNTTLILVYFIMQNTTLILVYFIMQNTTLILVYFIMQNTTFDSCLPYHTCYTSLILQYIEPFSYLPLRY